MSRPFNPYAAFFLKKIEELEEKHGYRKAPSQPTTKSHRCSPYQKSAPTKKPKGEIEDLANKASKISLEDSTDVPQAKNLVTSVSSGAGSGPVSADAAASSTAGAAPAAETKKKKEEPKE